MLVLRPNKNQAKHFISEREAGKGSHYLVGYPACHCYRDYYGTPLKAFIFESAKTRRGVTCGRCKKTKVFRGIK